MSTFLLSIVGLFLYDLACMASLEKKGMYSSIPGKGNGVLSIRN
jgi:hypothetical protein